MQIRKRTNLTKPKAVPSEGGRSTRPAPVRYPSLPGTLRNRPRPLGESSVARLRRLVRDTPGCAVCGGHEGLVVWNKEGQTYYRCAEHIRVNPAQYFREKNPSLFDRPGVKHRKRINLSERDK